MNDSIIFFVEKQYMFNFQTVFLFDITLFKIIELNFFFGVIH